MTWGPAAGLGVAAAIGQDPGAGAAGASARLCGPVPGRRHPRSTRIRWLPSTRPDSVCRIGHRGRWTWQTTANRQKEAPWSTRAERRPHAQFPITTALEFPEWTIERSLGMVFGLVVR